MKIIQFIGSLSDGGAETLVKNYALLLNNRTTTDGTIEIVVVTVLNVKYSANYQCLSNSNIKIIPIYRRFNKLTRLSRKIIGNLYVPYILKKIVKKEKADVIHCHLSVLHYLTKIRYCLNNVRLVYTCHSEPYYLLGPKKPFENKAAQQLIKDNGLQMIALHTEMKYEIDKMFGINTTRIVHNGVNLERFSQVSKSKMQLRKDLNIPLDAFVIGHVGRFSSPKNHSFIISIFSKLLKCKPNAYLLLVGSGALQNKVNKIIGASNIEGHYQILSHRLDIPEILKTMDVFFFPSIWEGMPVSLIEAQAAGLYCVKSTNITDDAIITQNVASLSLEDSSDVWINALLNEKYRGSAVSSIEDFSDKNMIDELLTIYTR